MVEHDHELDAACLATRDEFSALLDDELSPVARLHVESHLAECSDCLRALDGMKKVTDLYAALPPVMAPADFEDRVRSAVRPKGMIFSLRKRILVGTALAAAAGLALVALPSLQGKHSVPEATYLAKKSNTTAAPAAPASPPPAPMAMRAMAAPEEKKEQRTEASDVVADSAAPAGPAAAAPVKDAPAPAKAKFAPAPAPAPAAESAPAPQAGGTAPAAAAIAPAPAAAAPAPKPAPAAKKTNAEPPMRPNGPVKDEGRHWNTAQRSFVFKAGVWQQVKYAGEPVTPVSAKGGAFKVLVDKHPELKLLAQANAPIIFRVEDKWYKYNPAKN